MKTDTAHRAWDEKWATEEGRAGYTSAEPDVIETATELSARLGSVRALDLGCGVGRHALLFARLGFEVSAVDLAEAGLAELRRAAAAEDLEIDARVAPMTELPFADGAFDYVLSFNVLCHGDREIVRTAIGEIRRVLRQGGVFQGTMLSKRNAGFGIGTEVAPDTFVREPGHDMDEEDKAHPHFYCDAAGLVAL
ncbi:MAG TPA: class I SAM-dependent methyltransferase, partial [Bauldia sp.]|nr:class I SAM-dependent methyltransferase [Bauldia sp.]